MTEVSCLSIFLSTAAMPIFMFLFRFVNWAKFFHSKWNLISCIVLNTKRRSMDCVEQLEESFCHGSGITSHRHQVLPWSDWIELLPQLLPLTFYFCHELRHLCLFIPSNCKLKALLILKWAGNDLCEFLQKVICYFPIPLYFALYLLLFSFHFFCLFLFLIAFPWLTDLDT